MARRAAARAARASDRRPSSLTSAPPTLAARAARSATAAAESLAQRLDLFEPDPAIVPAADRGDAPGEHALDDRDRLGEQGARIARACAVSRLDRVRHRPRARRRSLPRGERGGRSPGVQPFGGERPQRALEARARVGRVGVGRVFDEGAPRVRGRRRRGRPWRAPSSGRTSITPSAPRRRRHAGKARDARSAHQPEEHCLGLVVEVVGGRDRLGADRLRVGGEQPVARLARPLHEAGRRLRARPRQASRAGRRGRWRDARRPRPPPRSPASGDDRPWRRTMRASRRAAHSAAMTRSAVESGPPETAISVAFGEAERREQRVDRGGVERGSRAQAPQWFFAISRSARRFTEAVASGSARRIRRRWRRPDPCCRARPAPGRDAPCFPARGSTSNSRS